MKSSTSIPCIFAAYTFVITNLEPAHHFKCQTIVFVAGGLGISRCHHIPVYMYIRRTKRRNFI